MLDHPSDPLLDRPSWAPDWIPSITDTSRIRILRWFIWGVLVAGLGGCVLRGADEPADPELGAPVTTSTAPLGALATQFGSVIVELISATGQAVELCLLHADSPAERGQGLMHVSDPTLEGYDGMLFTNEEPTGGAFYMFNTLIPLRVAWWGADGAFVGSADMVPCASTDSAACTRYPSPAPFLYGIEVTDTSPLRDQLVAGARISVGEGACPPRPA